MTQLDDRLIAVGFEHNLHGRRSRRKRRISGNAPREDNPIRWLDRNVRAARLCRCKIESKHAAGPSIEIRRRPNPLHDKRRIDQVRKHVRRRRCDTDSRGYDFSGVHRFVCPWFLLFACSTTCLSRSSASGHRSTTKPDCMLIRRPRAKPMACRCDAQGQNRRAPILACGRAARCADGWPEGEAAGVPVRCLRAEFVVG